jgi:hypothetical protein
MFSPMLIASEGSFCYLFYATMGVAKVGGRQDLRIGSIGWCWSKKPFSVQKQRMDAERSH